MKTLFGNPQQELFAKVNTTSLDITDERIEALKQIFPAIVTDGKIDWGMLKAMLGESLEKEGERYRFTWNGKSAAIMEAQTVSSKTLVPDIESSKNWNDTENLYIEGDNLEVLKLLQNSYNGKIKMIYIDPPYNTGNDFVYKDDFVLSQEEMELNEEIKDKKGTIRTLDRLQKNDRGSAKYHTNWLNMMYPRLSLARDLLTEDGVIFISIDDNEVHNLRKICDEIFGENNFVSDIIWKHTQQSKNDERHFSRQYNHTIVYTKKIDILHDFYFERTEEDNKNYSNPDSDIKGPWRSGDVRSPSYRKTLCFDLKAPNGNIIKSPPNGWRWSEESIKEKINQGEIIFKNDNSGIIRKIYLNNQKGRTPENLWQGEKYGTTRQATAEIKKLFNDVQIFDTPKPKELIVSMLEIVSQIKENDIILDFFSGSATTAHAVMQLNAEDGGNRKFIMVQLPEELEEKSEAYKEGYRTICDIGRKRIKLAGEKIISENPEANIDAGFKVFKVETSNIKEWDTEYESVESSVNQAITGTLSMFKDGRSPLDIVYELLLKERLPLTSSVDSEEINGSKLFNINEGMMYIYLGELNDEVVKRIIELKNESFDDNPRVILDESKLSTEMKSNAKKTFDSNGIKDVRTI